LYRYAQTGKIAFFAPQKKPRPSFFWLEERSAGQAFAEGFANSERRILDETYMLYTDSASVLYRSAVFKKSKIAAARVVRR
jgi:hypothetical protein